MTTTQRLVRGIRITKKRRTQTMTVGELVRELLKYPNDMPVAVYGDIYYPPEHPSNRLTIEKRTWVDSNYPWNRPDFEYINIE